VGSDIRHSVGWEAMIRLDAATVLRQWASDGLLFL
jgi:hypothetical protein